MHNLTPTSFEKSVLRDAFSIFRIHFRGGQGKLGFSFGENGTNLLNVTLGGQTATHFWGVGNAQKEASYFCSKTWISA